MIIVCYIVFSDPYVNGFLYAPNVRSVATQTDVLDSIEISDEDDNIEEYASLHTVLILSDDSDAEMVS